MKINENQNPGGEDNKLPPSLADLMDGDDPIIPFKDEDDDEDEEKLDKDKKDLNKDNLDSEEIKKQKEVEKENKKIKDQEEEENKRKELEEKEKNKGKDGEEEEEEEEKDKGKTNNFWSDVEKITGEKVEVDFGDTEIDTPEGAAKYAKAFRDKGIEDFETTLEKEYPREYKALQLANAGIDPSYLYKEQSEIDFSKIKLDEANVEDSKKWYTEYLKSKGNSAEDIIDLVKAAEDKGKLLERAKLGLKELQDNQISSEKQKREQADIEIKERDEVVKSMTNVLKATIEKGEIGNFIIPEKDRNPLLGQVLNGLRLIDGRFYSMEEISDKNLMIKLQSEYFKLKKGDLGELVTRKAKTENVRRLKSKVEKADAKKPTGSGGSVRGNSLSLQDLTED